MKIQRRIIYAILIALAALPVACIQKVSACGSDAPLMAAKGCGQFILGKTKRSQLLPNRVTEEQFSKSGLFFEFDNHDRLSAIVVTSPAFAEQSGIRVGDLETTVVAKHGKGRVEDMKLMKGDMVFGSIGDRILAYPGVEFVILHDKVWAIRVMRD